jgi:hypothetical protein
MKKMQAQSLSHLVQMAFSSERWRHQPLRDVVRYGASLRDSGISEDFDGSVN